MDEQTIGPMVGQMDRPSDGPTGGRADVQKGGMDRRIDRWTERRMGGRTKTEVCRVASPRLQISDIPLF